MRLSGKVALVTGAGSGIGRRTAQRFAAEGARVVIADVNRTTGEEATAEIQAAGGDALFIAVDTADPAQVMALMKEAAAWGGKLDILFNNAGFGPPSDARATDVAEEVWDSVLGVNLRGVFLCSKYGIPCLVQNGGGSVINTASVAGLRGNSTIPSTAYTVSKAGVIGLTRQLAIDYARYQVRVNAICPGPIRTPNLEPFLSDPVVLERFTKGVPLGRMGTTDDVANLVLFLASDESSWITGSIITIDGGLTAG